MLIQQRSGESLDRRTTRPIRGVRGVAPIHATRRSGSLAASRVHQVFEETEFEHGVWKLTADGEVVTEGRTTRMFPEFPREYTFGTYVSPTPFFPLH